MHATVIWQSWDPCNLHRDLGDNGVGFWTIFLAANFSLVSESGTPSGFTGNRELPQAAPPKTNQTITFNRPFNLAAATLNQSVPLTASASSGLDVSFTSNSGTVCTISGSNAIILTAGTCSITANQGGNGSFNAAPAVTQTFNVNSMADTTPPVLTVPDDIVANTSPGLSTAVVSYPTPTATDNVGVVSLVRTAGPASGSVFPLGLTTITYRATDVGGNDTTRNFTVRVLDNEPPTIGGFGDITVNVDPGTNGAIVTYASTYSDNAPGGGVVLSPVSGSTFPVGFSTVTVTATDASDNAVSDTFTVTVVDNEAPVITAPSATWGQTAPGLATKTSTFVATALDAVDGSVAPTFTSSPTPGLASGSAFPIGITTVTVRAEDAAGNVATALVFVEVADLEPPTIGGFGDITVDVDPGTNGAVVTYASTYSDNAPGGGVVLSPVSGSIFPVGSSTVTVTATDASGNSATDTFTVTVVDNEAPVITAPFATFSFTEPGLATRVVNFTATATDVVDGQVTVTFTSAPTPGLASGSSFPVGTTTVTARAEDEAGNVATQPIFIEVVDREAPVITPPANITVPVDSGTSGAVVDFVGAATATDNVGVTGITYSPLSGSDFAVGTTTVTAVASDLAGNTADTTFTVTVLDNEAPTITAPMAINDTTSPGQRTRVVTFEATAFDEVYGDITPTFTSLPTAGLASGSAFPIGATTVTVRAEDQDGNVATQDIVVTITDEEPPTIIVPDDINVDTDPSSSTAVVDYVVTADDNSGPVTPTLTSGFPSGTAFSVGTWPILWTVIDPSGNSASGSFTITVEDNEMPVVTVPENITVNTDPGLPSAIVPFQVSVVDAVDGELTPVITSSPVAGLTPGSAFPIGDTTVTVAGTDNAQNTASASFTVTVTDNQVPIFTSVQGDILLEVDFDQTTGVVNFPTPTASDNSGIVTVAQTQGPVSGSAFPLGTTLVEFTATDGSGLTSTLQFNVSLALIPPGTVTFVVNSPDDGTVNFTSATAAFNTSVVVTGGSGSSGGLQVVPGTYSASYILPTGFAVTSASCSSASGTVDIGTQTLSMTFARGESYTCTLSSRDIAAQTQEQLQNFMDTRARLIVANQPNRDRRVARVNGDSNPNTVSMFGHTVNTGVMPFGVMIGESQVQVTFSSTSASADLLTARSDWDLWFESTFSRYETSYGEGQFGILHAGADYRIAPNAIFGVGLQVDTAEEDVLGSSATSSGLGWMVGPYFTARIGEGLYFDANLRYGQSNMEISPLGTYVDDVSTERFLANIALFGSHDYSETLNIQPSVGLTYFEETSEAYVDSLLVPIAAVTTRFGELEAGSRFTWSDPLGSYSTYVELDGIYTFDASGTSLSAISADMGLRARAGFGGTVAVGASGMVDYSFSYDGLGDDSYEAITVSLGYSMNF